MNSVNINHYYIKQHIYQISTNTIQLYNETKQTCDNKARHNVETLVSLSYPSVRFMVNAVQCMDEGRKLDQNERGPKE